MLYEVITHFGILGTSPGNGALGVVDDQFFRHPTEPFKGPPVAGQPGGNLLIKNDLGILVPGVTQRHDEKPGRSDLTCVEIDQFGSYNFV